RVVTVLLEVLVQVLERRDVGVHPVRLGVGDEDDAVHALQDEPPAGVVVYLPGHGVQVEPGLEAADAPQVHGEEVEEERALRLRGQRDELSAGLRVDPLIYVLEVRGLSAEAGPVVDDLAVDLPARVVDHRHRPPPYSLKRRSISLAAAAAQSAASDSPGSGARCAASAKSAASAGVTSRALRRTSPSVVSVSKTAARTASPSTSVRNIDRVSPWCTSDEHSFSPMRRASWSLAAKSAAAREAKATPSIPSVWPAMVSSRPVRSMRTAHRAPAASTKSRRSASRRSRSSRPSDRDCP